jgi:uncharacterized protein YcbK (DUF882 family)
MKYFKPEEFACHCCGVIKMDAAFLDKLDRLRDQCGFPLTVLSGYRCSEHNSIVSETGVDGPHTFGLAADIQCSGANAWYVLDHAMSLGFHGIGVKQKGDIGARFLHLDMMPLAGLRPRIWSY